MKGGIYSDQRCPRCGGTFKDDGRTGLYCPQHPECRATRFKMKFGPIYRRHDRYDDAMRDLTGLRFKTDEKTFDPRDYRKDQPMGYANQVDEYLDIRLDEVRDEELSREHYNNMKNYLGRGAKLFENRNVKTIGFPDFQALIRRQKDLSGKSKANMMSAIHAFWVWMRRCGIITLAQFPEFPVVKYTLGYRNTASKEVQLAVLEEVKRISYAVNPKIWVGLKLLCTYHSIRPGELNSLQERGIDTSACKLYFPTPKEGRFKDVAIRTADMDLLMSFARSPFPATRFFRHPAGLSGVHENEPFGERYLYKWFKKACANLGIKNLDMYGATKHSIVRDLRKKGLSPEEIRRSGKLATNAAFDRYYGDEDEERIREIYELSAPDTVLTPFLGGTKKAKYKK